MRRTLVGLGVVFLLSAVSVVAQTKGGTLTISTVRLEITGLPATTFVNCSSLGTSTEVVEIKSTDTKTGAQTITKVPGATKANDIYCVRQFSSDTTFAAWRKQVEDGNIASARRNGAVVLLDDTGTEVARFNFTNGWPAYLTLDSVTTSSTSQPAYESLYIAIDDITRAP